MYVLYRTHSHYLPQRHQGLVRTLSTYVFSIARYLLSDVTCHCSHGINNKYECTTIYHGLSTNRHDLTRFRTIQGNSCIQVTRQLFKVVDVLGC